MLQAAAGLSTCAHPVCRSAQVLADAANKVFTSTGSQPLASGPYQPFGAAPLDDAAGTSRSGSLQGLQNRSGSGKAQPPPSPFGNPDQQNTLIPQAQGDQPGACRPLKTGVMHGVG